MTARALAANVGWLASALPAALSFERALRRPEEAQRELLLQLLQQNAPCAYGRRHDFESIRSYEQFRATVPVVTADEIAPWIERIAQGEERVLTAEPVTRLMPTSGSTGPRKLIPVTAGLQRQFNRAVAAWITDLARDHASIVSGPAYWSVTPAFQAAPEATTRVRVGFESDSAYLGARCAWLVNAGMAVPTEVGRIGNLEAFRYVVLLFLLRSADLRLISIWHPSYLSLLLDALPPRWGELVRDIEHGACRVLDQVPFDLQRKLTRLGPDRRRAAELRAVGPADVVAIWPNLSVVSCWADAASDLPCQALRARLGPVRVQPKGLLSTEGVVSIPFRDTHPLAIGSHFFEFLDEQGGISTAANLEIGKSYEVLLTTAGGLWRYRTGDTINVTGRLCHTPTVRFLGRVGGVSDLRGEKLSEKFVNAVRERIFASTDAPAFAMLAPDPAESDVPTYTLYVEGEIGPDLAVRLETELLQNPHYAYCRQLGQLGAARIYRIERGAFATFADAEIHAGARLGDVKPRALSRRSDWRRQFKGHYLEQSPATGRSRVAGVG